MAPDDPYVMYLILRRDLLEQLRWPIGALVSQGAHAATACIWKYRDDPDLLTYMKNVDHMRKITLEVSSEQELLDVVKVLKANNLDYTTWIEDDMPVCVAIKPQRRSIISKYVKTLRLFG